MSSSIPGKISINQGTFTEDTCTVNYDLIKNQANFPAIRNMLEYANRRSLATMLVSGVVTPYGVNNTEKTKIPQADSKKGIGSNGYRFDVMGRIEKASEILRQVGATAADGTFQLLMKDKHLVPGMNAVFHGQRFQARVMSYPTGNASSGYLYTFQNPSGDLFVYATHVATQSGTKTCMGAYTSYSEKSLRGYGRSKFPDVFINHMTTQRKTCAISGGAASNVLWYQYTNDGGAMSKGWMYQELQQAQAQFVMENERAKWFGISSMKNTDGTLAANSRLIDTETGLPIIQGDGWEEQVAGGNVGFGSGTNGDWTLSDITDLLMKLELNSDKINGLSWVGVTGTKGYALVQGIAATLAGNQNTTIFNQVTQNGQPGGAIVETGYNFQKLNINGNSIMFVKHPLFDDRLMFTELDSDGMPAQSSTLFIMNVGSGAQMNMEVLCKEANGIKRDDVTAKINGMTGSSEVSLSEEDAMKYAMLKEDLLVIYNTQECGILRKNI
jgi:hypothetical protein